MRVIRCIQLANSEIDMKHIPLEETNTRNPVNPTEKLTYELLKIKDMT